MLFDPSLAPLGGLSLVVVGTFLWARRMKSGLWYTFCAGFALMLIAFLAGLTLGTPAKADAGMSAVQVVLEILKALGLWVSAVAIMIIGLSAQPAK